MLPTQSTTALNRRNALKALLAFGTAAWGTRRSLFGQGREQAGTEQVLSYLETLRRADGGYAWHGQVKSHLTPTFFAIGCYQILGENPPEKAALVRFTRENHPYAVWARSSRRYSFDHQQIQALAWLGEDVSSFRDGLTQLKAPRAYNERYETGGNPHFEAEVKHFRSRELCGLPAPAQSFVDYIEIRRRNNGSYNTTPATDGGDGNALNTWFALEALATIGQKAEAANRLTDWLQACQLASGGFTHQPNPELGGLDDVAYTWAAVKSLSALRAQPDNLQACIDYIHSLANHDGGFADRPGWYSNPMATFYALDSLATLADLNLNRIRRRAKPPVKSLPDELNVYSVQIESHGRGSPIETVELAKALKIHLWGAKNAQPDWREKVAEVAQAQRVPVTLFSADEEYGSLIRIPGSGTFSHIADLMAPARADIGNSLAKAGPVTWSEFKRRRLSPLYAGQGRLNWQFGVHEDAIRLFLDESVLNEGYATISTFHFGNIDFSTSEPFLHRWRGQLPYIALQDAHGIEPWWFSDQTEGMRTLFLGTEPTWTAWLKALDRNWVAAVRHDYRTDYQTWIHSGSDEMTDFINNRQSDWRWWDNPSISRPLISLAALRPDDVLEVGRPNEGVNLRLRLAHRNSNQGLIKEPLAELVSLTIDGKQVEPEQVSVPAKRDPKSLEDLYYLFPLPDSIRPITAVATINDLQRSTTVTKRLTVTP